MTTLCGGGTSGPKSGVAETIIFTAGSLSSLLNNRGGYWATIAAPLLGVLAYSATDLCSTDPPAQPTISDEEYTALLQLGPWDTLQTALGKLSDLVKRVVWFDMCQCTSVATPALPSNTLDPPADVQLPDYGGGANCPQPRARVTVPKTNPGTSYKAWSNITRQIFPGIPTLTSVANSSAEAQDIIATPANWGNFTMIADWVSGVVNSPYYFAVAVNGFDANLQMINQIQQVYVRGGSTHRELTSAFQQSTWPYFSVNTNTGPSTTTDGVLDLQIDLTCAAGGPGTNGCCSDPATVALLGQLLQQINLIQRQQVPFAYVPGAAHTGLTGTGEITVQGLLGALVEITAGVAVVGTELGTPDQTFEAGWITWGNADGFSQREFIANETLLSLPALAGQYTRIGYTLPVGLTVSITELVREP